MKLKSTSRGSFFLALHKLIPKNKKQRIIFGVVVVCLIGCVIYYVGVRDQKVDCKELTPKFEQVYTDDTTNLTQLQKKYQQLKVPATTCKDGKGGVHIGTQPDTNLSSLAYYHSIAIASYSFGDYKQANIYADKVLELNKRVGDNQRGKDLPSANVIATQMEAIKHGNF